MAGNAPLYLHLIFSREIFNELSDKMHRLRNEIKTIYARLAAQGTWNKNIKSNPELKAEHLEMIEKGYLVFDAEHKMFNIRPAKANKFYRAAAIRILASNFIADAKTANEIYAARNSIEQSYRWTKDELGGRTLNVSTEKSLET